MLKAVGLIIIIIIYLSLSCDSAPSHQSKALCYSGSNLYQQIVQNCNQQDSSYNGAWYCATISVCESYISSSRQCIITKGCATAAQCTSGYNNNATFNDYYVQEKTPSGLQNYGGMTIQLSCCLANSFPNDDTIATDYSQICNSASLLLYNTMGVTILIISFVSFLFI